MFYKHSFYKSHRVIKVKKVSWNHAQNQVQKFIFLFFFLLSFILLTKIFPFKLCPFNSAHKKPKQNFIKWVYKMSVQQKELSAFGLTRKVVYRLRKSVCSKNFIIIIITTIIIKDDLQKQPPDVLCKKRCSLKFRKFQRKTSVLESLFNTFSGQGLQRY